MNLAAWTGWDLELCGRLCLVLAHSLWQFALLAALATLVTRIWRNTTPEQIYAIYAGTLLLGLAALPITFLLTRLPGESLAMSEVATAPQQQILPGPNSPPAGQSPVQQAAPPPFMAEATHKVPIAVETPHFWATTNFLSWTPRLVACYAVGVAIMLLRLLRGLWQNYRLSAQARPIVSGPLMETLQGLARSWSLRVTPVLALTERVIVPQVVGLWRPTILLPAAALAGLHPDELEMILAHELAHVRRHDLWANLVQRLAEVGLFFNPAVWYLSRRISTYREYCCDEATCLLARQSAGDTRLRYAEALLRAVELTEGAAHGQKLAALAVSGSRPSELRRRVARLLGEPVREPVRITRTGLMMILVGGAILAMIPLTRQNAAELESKANPEKGTAKPQVEVVAIGTHDEEPQRWWDAEGKLLKSVPFTWEEAGKVSTADKLWRRIVIRVDAPATDDVTDINWQIEGARGSASGKLEFTEGFEPGKYLTRYYSLADGTETFGLRVGIAKGPWKKFVEAGPNGVATGLMKKSIVFSRAYPAEQGTMVVVSHNVFDRPVRIIAVDRTGKTHDSAGRGGYSAGQIYQSPATFPGLSPEEIDHFEFQTREYEWTEIKDLPVEPGEKTAKTDRQSQNSDSAPVATREAAKIAALKELVESYEAMYRRVEALHKLGVAGGEVASKWRAYYSLCVARADLANAQRKFREAVKHYQEAVKAAEEVVTAIQARHESGRATLGEVLEATAQRSRAKIALSEAQEGLGADARTEGGESEREQESTADGTREMRVRVVDTDGKPLQGVELFRNHAYYEVEGERSQFENDTYYTDETGAVSIPLSGQTRILRIWARKPGFVPQFANWERDYHPDGDQIPESFEYRLKPGSKISGVVTNVAGIPISGVRVEVEDSVASYFSIDRGKLKPVRRPIRDSHLAYGSAAVRTDAAGRWSLDNVPTDEELVLSEDDSKDQHKTPLRLRFSHPDYETIDGIEDWQTVWNPSLESLRDSTASTVMKWVNRNDHGRVNAVRLEQGEQYKNADFSGRYFKGQQLMVWSDNMLAEAKLAGSTWEDMLIPGMAGLLHEADLSGAKLINVQVSGQSGGMQKTNFSRAVLESANMMGGVSGFQEAKFDEATITNSDLTGGGSSFQAASFQGAKLHSSKLKGVGPAFQLAHFDDAKLVKTTISCDSPTAFQGVTLNNTEFIECDLSSIAAEALASCEFNEPTPPRYDAKTKLPEGFDPQEYGWKLMD